MGYVTPRRVLRGLKRPTYAAGVAWRLLTQADERFMAQLTGATRAEIKRYMEEPFRDARFAAHLAECETRLEGRRKGDVADKRTLRLIHAAIRAARPAMVVETGVKNGWSSAYILHALEANGEGHLHSLDIDAQQGDGRETGWIVPDWLRDRWTFRQADATQALEPLLGEIGGTDVFFHDSLHTYDHMMWEFQASYPFIRAGGLLLSDDAVWNDAFMEFAGSVGATRAGLLSGLGALRKEPS